MIISKYVYVYGIFVSLILAIDFIFCMDNQFREQIQQKIITSVQNSYKLLKDDIEVKFIRFPVLALREKEYDHFKIIPYKSAIVPGYNVVAIKVYQKEKLLTTLTVSMEVAIYQEVLVVDKKIHRGDMLSAENLRLQKLRISQKFKRVFTSLTQVAKAEALTFVDEGTILNKNMLRIPPILKRGSKVNVQIVSRNLVITTDGVVREDGDIGDRVQIRCKPAGKNFIGIVQTADLVIVKI